MDKYEQICKLIGRDRDMALRVKEYCIEVEKPTIEELRDIIRKCGAEYESVALSLKDYNDDKDDDGREINFTLGEMEVGFSSSPGYQSIQIGDLNLDTDTPDFLHEPSFTTKDIRKIKTQCKKYFPDHDPDIISDIIIDLLGNRDSCAH